MPLVVNTNVASLTAQRNLTFNTTKLNRSLERLSSGLRINRASDDAAGLTISETLRSSIRGLKMALQNAQDGVSILQIAEGTLSVVNDNLQRIRELTVQAANDTNSDAQRDAIESEIQARLTDNQRIVNAAQFNNIKLLNGSAINARIQIGPDSDVNENTLDISVALGSTFATTLFLLEATLGGGVTSTGWGSIASIDFVSPGAGVTGGDMARRFLSDLDRSIVAISQRRSLMGAFQTQLESAIQNLQLDVENFTSSESRIRDLDMANETSELTKSKILQQAALSILTQANQAPELALSLLQ